MENKNICKYQKDLKKDYFLKNEVLVCNYAKKNGCPYGNGEKLSWEEEEKFTICLTKGLTKKLD